MSRDFLTFFTKQNLKCFKIDKNHKAKLFIILIMLKGLNAVFNIKYTLFCSLLNLGNYNIELINNNKIKGNYSLFFFSLYK